MTNLYFDKVEHTLFASTDFRGRLVSTWYVRTGEQVVVSSPR